MNWNIAMDALSDRAKLLREFKNDNYNPGHNILELYNILVKIRFTTSKTKLDI